MTREQEAYLAKANQALAAARLLLGAGAVEACLSQSYYAMFYVAQAALLGVGESPKTHSGTRSRFSFHFVASGRAPATLARLLSDAFETRLRADYDAISVFDENAAADALADAEAFVAAVRPLVTAP